MNRVFAWAIFIAFLVGAGKFISAWQNPWSSRVVATRAQVIDVPPPSSAALWVPSCKQKGACS